ncbi:GbsR/MarR family transcriptional regulator [Formosa sp. S-31]|uniref:GbsR/MarR family transcriptional regulator n=1 Tax=Formosa sp. S-31 TaxID=2790949 RepID=UPI003EB698A7
MEKQICKEKLRLVEKLGVFIERNDKLAPVAARIISYAILTGKSGITFDDLVTNLCASKSTISTHLNHLLDLKRLTYFTKQGDRKKYFIVNEDTIIQHIDEMVEAWTTQKELHIEIKHYKEKVNTTIENDSEKFDMDFHDNYITYLNEVTDSVTILKEKILKSYKN